ncbi:MAG TPA: branched-chain amino acid transaminase [Thermomicrobiales bacterium]|nr:branched-chain amino acid transaminase [Thermomicrobiales bacterium]
MAAEHPNYIYWNDRLVAWDDATVHVTAIAWSAIGAVFEGIRGYWNAEQEQLHIFRLEDHLERLQNSAKVVHLPLSRTREHLTDIIVELVRVNECREDTYIFPLVFAADAESNRYDPTKLQSELTIRTRPMPSHLRADYSHKARVSSWTRISDTVMPPRIKNISNYRNGQLATHEVRQDGYDVAFMLNPQGKIAEAPGACVAMIAKGKLITPDVTSGILESITRDAVITLARGELGIEVVERPVERTELYLADEVFTCGTAAEITPVVSVDRYTVGDGKVGETTMALQAMLDDILRGREERYAHWRTSVDLAMTTA